MMKCYRFVTKDLKSENGDISWVVGEWVKHEGELKLCESGLHASKEPLDSLNYVFGDRWYVSEARGKILEEDDKFCASEMRLIKEIPLRVIQQFAVDCAERCLKNFEEICPDDKRPREAIEAAKYFIENPCEETRSAARSAARSAGSAAWSAARSAAWSAGSAAWSAAWSAGSAARSAARSAAWSAGSAAWSAAGSAAWSAAGSAAWSAESAARSAAWSAESTEKKWQNKHLKQIIKEALKEK